MVTIHHTFRLFHDLFLLRAVASYISNPCIHGLFFRFLEVIPHFADQKRHSTLQNPTNQSNLFNILNVWIMEIFMNESSSFSYSLASNNIGITVLKVEEKFKILINHVFVFEYQVPSNTPLGHQVTISHARLGSTWAPILNTTLIL